MLKKLVLTSLLVAQTIFAAEGNVSTVVKLANTVKSVALTSEASQENIDAVEVKLRDAIELLTSESPSTGNSGNSGEFVACYEFAYQKYYINLNSSNAADKATAACKAGLDLEVAKFLYEKYYINLNAVNSMDKAAAGSGKQQRGKLDLIKFMYEKHYINLNSSISADKAVEGAAKLNRDSLVCVQKLYATYYVSHNATNSVNSAVAGCSK